MWSCPAATTTRGKTWSRSYERQNCLPKSVDFDESHAISARYI
jgi:hypothetical protein